MKQNEMSKITIQAVESITVLDKDMELGTFAIIGNRSLAIPNDSLAVGDLCILVPWDKLHLVRKGSVGYGESDAIDQEPRDIVFPFVPDTVTENRNPAVSVWHCPALDVRIKTTELWHDPTPSDQHNLAVKNELTRFMQSVIDEEPKRLSWLTGSPEAFVGLDITKSVELITGLNDNVNKLGFDEEDRDGE